MAATTATRTGTYKGRTYRVLWSGKTRYGERAHLQFMDGTKDFWVSASLVSAGSASSTSRSGGRRYDAPVPGCADCRRLGHMCPQCHFDEYDD